MPPISHTPAPAPDLLGAIEAGLLGEFAWADTLPEHAGAAAHQLGSGRRPACDHTKAI